MSRHPDEPLRKVTLNLYEEDCAWLERNYGRGWSEQVRQWVHAKVQARANPLDHFSGGPRYERP